MLLSDQKCTILVGEDEPEVLSYLETALKCMGYAVESARDGDEVLACLRSGGSEITAVLLDIVMLNRDGLDTLREIRSLDRQLPVIMLSGASVYSERGHRDEARGDGFSREARGA